jgi:SRSO17 transposase
MLDGRRKSMQPMAQRLGVDHQQWQQFMSTSTWDHVEVRRRLAEWAGDFVDPDALVVDDTGFLKDGKDSPGVTATGTRSGAPAVASSRHVREGYFPGRLPCAR